MTRKSDPREWTLELSKHDGYWIVDAYGEDIGWAGNDYTTAKAALDAIIIEEIEAYDQENEGPDPMRGVEFPFAENH